LRRNLNLRVRKAQNKEILAMLTTGNTLSRYSRRLLILSVILWANISIVAQQPSPTPVDAEILKVTADKIIDKSNVQTGWAVTIRFNTAFDTTQTSDVTPATNAANYRIININSGLQVPVSTAEFIKTPGADTTLRVRLVITANDALNTADFFHLYALNI